MQLKIPTEVCRSYIDSQTKRAEALAWERRKKEPLPVVTISRQAGAGGVSLAQKLAQYLQQHDKHAACPWTVFDKQLVQKVLEDHKLSASVARFMPDEKYSEIRDTVEELLGLHPARWTLVEKMSETILHIAQMGNAILVGRGANVIIGFAPNAVHVRLVGSIAKRVRNCQEYYNFSPEQAAEYVRQTDQGRDHFLKRHFNRNIDDPSLYHLVINTDVITPDEAVSVIGRVVQGRLPALQFQKHEAGDFSPAPLV
ncbi:MAG: cytidylate kinase family protein [Verrucomicrobia bacterium]|nr:cytidylate kinase family protein [Verrucomicrobiota bacterium]